MQYLTNADKATTNSVCIFCAKVKAADESEHVLCRGQFAYITLNRFPTTTAI